jgi:hypothetical protein
MMRRVLAGAMLAGLAGCAAARPGPASSEPRVMACPHIPPPPPSAAHVPAPPKSGFAQILQPGHWDWADYDYTWVPARWLTLLTVARPRWQPGHWRQDRGACIWEGARFILPDNAKASPAP